jgi:hypothetical protein
VTGILIDANMKQLENDKENLEHFVGKGECNITAASEAPITIK